MPRIQPFEIEPVSIECLDGKNRTFILTIGGMNRLKKRFSVKDVKELMNQSDDAVFAILWEALIDKGDLTEEKLTELIPYQPLNIAKAVGQLFGASFPDPQKAALPNPTVDPATGAQTRPN